MTCTMQFFSHTPQSFSHPLLTNLSTHRLLTKQLCKSSKGFSSSSTSPVFTPIFRRANRNLQSRNIYSATHFALSKSQSLLQNSQILTDSFRNNHAHLNRYHQINTLSKQTELHRTTNSDKGFGLNTFKPKNEFEHRSCLPSHQSTIRAPFYLGSIINSPNFNPIFDQPNLPFMRNNKCFNSNSFIKSVLEQVKKDIENQPELKKAMENMKQSAQQNRSSSQRLKTQFFKKYEAFQILVKSNTEQIKEIYSTIITHIQILSGKLIWFKKSKEYVSHINSMLKPKLVFFNEKLSKITSFLKEEKESEKKVSEWRREQAIKRYEKEHMNKENTSETQETVQNENSSQGESSIETALILSKSSAWDQFGTRLKDMPFLQSFYENPFFGKLFGETEIAASIREMKETDKSFRFPEFMETVQQVVAPHLVDCFLHGDRESLKLLCGEAAFSAASASIKERDIMKVTLDTSVLKFNGIDLIGAKRIEDDTPWFIFSFSTQQINCLRDFKGEIVAGAIDDIRDVVYSIALTKHPEPDTIGLHHPWMIKEFAIIGNNPSW